MPESTENNGFVLPKADDKTQAETAVATQTAENPTLPSIQEETGSRDLMIAGGIIFVLLIAFFFAKRSFTNSLVKKRVSPGKAGMAGWWLFIFLASVAIGAVLAAVNSWPIECCCFSQRNFGVYFKPCLMKKHNKV